MKRGVGLIGVLLVLGTQAVSGAEPLRLGNPLTGAEKVAIDAILAEPDEFSGRLVCVEGAVQAVCRAMGCWMELVGEEGAPIQIKVEDGVIVFPVSAVGRRAIAEGTVEVRELSRDEYLGMQRHRAEEQGEVFSEAELGEPPYRLVRILGTGAEILPDSF